MRNTMFNGQLSGLLTMNTIAAPGMHGLGPLEYLRGELLVLDGRCYVATAVDNSTMQVVERSDVAAPFFVHQYVEQWTPIPLPEQVNSLARLDSFLTAAYGERGTPFAFKLTGHFTSLDLHIVRLPSGSEVHGPDDAHKGTVHYRMEQRSGDAIGFFSTQHKAVFTHHDANTHVHAITTDRSCMGHVESLQFDPLALSLFIAMP